MKRVLTVLGTLGILASALAAGGTFAGCESTKLEGHTGTDGAAETGGGTQGTGGTE
jgi:hypothetical protein